MASDEAVHGLSVMSKDIPTSPCLGSSYPQTGKKETGPQKSAMRFCRVLRDEKSYRFWDPVGHSIKIDEETTESSPAINHHPLRIF